MSTAEEIKVNPNKGERERDMQKWGNRKWETKRKEVEGGESKREMKGDVDPAQCVCGEECIVSKMLCSKVFKVCDQSHSHVSHGNAPH